MNENRVISTLTAVKYTLHTKHRELTNHKARYTDALNDVKNCSDWSEQEQSAFCHSHATKQSLSNSHRNKLLKHLSQPKLYEVNQNFEANMNNVSNTKVHITTRERPQIDTISITITRIHRALNKTKMKLPTGDPTNNTYRNTNGWHQQHRTRTQPITK